VQRSFNQGKFIRTQLIRRGDMLNGATGDVLIRMGLGMVDTDLDLETVQSIAYVLKHADALNEQRITQTMRPRINLARLDSSATPEPDEIAGVVNKLVRRTGDEIDDLGRYNPYPKLRELVAHAAAQKNSRAVLAVLEPAYEQKAWLQVQERPLRREIRDKVEDLMVRAYNDTKKPEKAVMVQKYMAEERKAFSETERETRQFSYGRRNVPHKDKSARLDPVASQRARLDDIHQKQTHVEPQEPTVVASGTEGDNGAAKEAPKSEEAPKHEEAPKKETEPQVHDIKP
jgi:hypothetical protein